MQLFAHAEYFPESPLGPLKGRTSSCPCQIRNNSSISGRTYSLWFLQCVTQLTWSQPCVPVSGLLLGSRTLLLLLPSSTVAHGLPLWLYSGTRMQLASEEDVRD